MLQTGKQLKLNGLKKIERSHVDWLSGIRIIAYMIAKYQGTVSADDLRRWADEHDWHPHHPNAWGAVFRGAHWVAVGIKKSSYKTNHARRITVWGLRGV